MREKIIELNIDKQTIILAMHHHQKTQQHRDPAPVSRNGWPNHLWVVPFQKLENLIEVCLHPEHGVLHGKPSNNIRHTVTSYRNHSSNLSLLYILELRNIKSYFAATTCSFFYVCWSSPVPYYHSWKFQFIWIIDVPFLPGNTAKPKYLQVHLCQGVGNLRDLDCGDPSKV